MFFEGYRCDICHGPLNDEGICRPCERARWWAEERDRAAGITERCYECGEVNGMHIEGACSRWRDTEED